MALSKKTRFEVFKRDAFTCQYCGRKTPDVVLEVDHIIPRAEGGGDEIENLVASCFDCNRGKSARLLDDRAPVPDLESQTELIREREQQLLAYNNVKKSERERKERDRTEAWDYWFDVWDADTLPNYHTPWRNVLYGYVDKLGVEEVKDAIDITRAKFDWIKSDAVRYLNGVLRGKVAEREGRVVWCKYCGGRMNLSREEVRKHGLEGWYHVGCKQKNDG